MEYFEVVAFPAREVHPEILIARLADIGFESFVENDDGSVSAYIQAMEFQKPATSEALAQLKAELVSSWQIRQIPDQNWNAVWESSYEAVQIGPRLLVRAPFHPKPLAVEFDLVIMPKMSFGTAHHETTRLMAEYILDTEVSGKSLLDMGSGTGLLAILARKCGATPVTAIDNDEWAYANALENVQMNECADIEVLMGDSALLEGRKFEIIYANINRNILLADMPRYVSSLLPGGQLFISGFYLHDLEPLQLKAAELGMQFVSSRSLNQWTAASFTRI